MTLEQYSQVRKWMYRNARPLDIARWKYHFENGKKEDVLTALSSYQNSDGGFAHALEADSWNPNSSPIQTWCATDILHEIGITDRDNEIVKGILNYLEMKKDYEDGYWLAEVPSNNDYPHAPWWTYNKDSIDGWGYNPTINLVGFILYFAEKQSDLYQLGVKIALKAVNEFLNQNSIEDMHEIQCFIRFYEYCENAGIKDIYDRDRMTHQLKKAVKTSIGDQIEGWGKEYMCKPSQYMITPESMFYIDNKELADYEAKFIIESMNADGIWNLTWNWPEYPEEWAVSKNWWKANLILKNMMYLKEHDLLPNFSNLT